MSRPPLIGVSASVHDFGDYGGVGVHRPQRDAFELALVERALDRGLPILGMCRGVQLLNVALGGTLVQDVSLVSAGHPSDPGWARWKEVDAASVAHQRQSPCPGATRSCRRTGRR